MICLVGLCLLVPGYASALVHFDFEQMYYVHPQRQVWDFCMVKPDSVYHLFYHSIHEETPGASNGDTIWHATSADLCNWDLEGPVLTSGPGPFDRNAIWAPDVFLDPDSGDWVMAYTGCDSLMNQRICFARSDDLETWIKQGDETVLEPDPAAYIWNTAVGWADFRDPFVYRQDDQWHLLATAKKWITAGTGVVYHAVSDDLLAWKDVGPLFLNDGTDPWRVPESSQLKSLGLNRHLVFGEFDTIGLSVISHANQDSFTMAERYFIDYGYAPEIDSYDPDIFILSRITPYQTPGTEAISYVVKIDTLETDLAGDLEVHRPHPLSRQWASWSGLANIANPVFGDNPLMRGEPSSGLVGNGYYSSQEYFQGPLNAGTSGSLLGETATGQLVSPPFVVTGNRMDLLVGGGDYPATAYVALVDAATDTVIHLSTGRNTGVMSSRQWDLTGYQGQMVKVKIVDNETGPLGYIMADEIRESHLYVTAAEPAPSRRLLVDHGPAPNPFNPLTAIRFSLARPASVTLTIHDVRGREVWSSGGVSLAPGAHSLTWQGQDRHDHPLPAGTFLYRLQSNGQTLATGKLSLVK